MDSIRAGLLLALVFAFNVQAIAGSPEGDDYKVPDPQTTADHGFPWLCFATSIAGLIGLFFVVRRREQKEEEDIKTGRKKPVIPWYCRNCDRDVAGPECPRCHAPNPFDAAPTD